MQYSQSHQSKDLKRIGEDQNKIFVCFRIENTTQQFKLETCDTDNLCNIMNQFKKELLEMQFKIPQFVEYHLNQKIKTNLQRQIDPQLQFKAIFQKYCIYGNQIFVILKKSTKIKQKRFQVQPSFSYEFCNKKNENSQNIRNCIQSSASKVKQGLLTDQDDQQVGLDHSQINSVIVTSCLNEVKRVYQKASSKSEFSNQQLKTDQKQNSILYKIVVTYQSLQKVLTIVLQKRKGYQRLLQIIQRELNKIQNIEGKRFDYQLNNQIVKKQFMQKTLLQLSYSLIYYGQNEQTIHIKVKQKYLGG